MNGLRLVAALCLMAVTFPAWSQPQFKFENRNQKFDKVKADTTISFDFFYSNKGTEPLIISEQVFQELSADDQGIILEAGKAATAASAQFLRDKEAEIKQILLDQGMEISDPENNEQEFIDLATAAVWPKFYESIGGIEKLNAVLAEIGRDPVSE